MANTRSTPQRIAFTKAAIEKLPVPGKGKVAYWHDAKNPGLVVSVTANGVRTFRLYRKVSGKPERILIGRFPDLSIEEARGKANELKSQIAKGENPAARNKAIRREMLFCEMFDLYLERHAKLEKRSWKGDDWLYKKYLGDWASEKLSAIRREDVERRKAAVAKLHGRYSANRMLSLLSAIYGRAMAWGWKGENPAKGIAKYKEQKRERFVEPDEMPRLLSAIKGEIDNDARDAILLMLLTGARKMNVLAMRWQDIHFDRALWTIPMTKSGDPQKVALVPFAIELLSIRHKDNQQSVYVFPARYGAGHRVEVSTAWARIRKAAKLEDVRLHDLRRTLGSWQAAAGVSLPIIGKSLGHRDVSTTQIYARLNLDPVREAVTAATSLMLKAGGQA